jgi:two-component sensor histidine kinase
MHYTNAERMLEFAAEALRNIPGIQDCYICSKAIEGIGSRPEAFADCQDCQHFIEQCTVADEEMTETASLHPTDPYFKAMALATRKQQYGCAVMTISNHDAYMQSEAMLLNFANTMAMRLENLEYQNYLEEQIRLRTAELQKTLESRELLLHEIHHRVKNNLNVVISLLRLQFGQCQDVGIRDAIDKTVDRIRSMALVHKFLYQSEIIGVIDCRSFLDEFIDEIRQSYAVSNRVRFNQDIQEAVRLPVETAISIALILNELIINALKYGFPDGRSGNIWIRISALAEGLVQMTVQDDGVGLPADFKAGSTATLGMQLVHGLVGQIDGQLSITGDGGVTVRIIFPQVGVG